MNGNEKRFSDLQQEIIEINITRINNGEQTLFDVVNPQFINKVLDAIENEYLSGEINDHTKRSLMNYIIYRIRFYRLNPADVNDKYFTDIVNIINEISPNRSFLLDDINGVFDYIKHNISYNTMDNKLVVTNEADEFNTH